MNQQTKSALITFLELYLAELKNSDTPESKTVSVGNWNSNSTISRPTVAEEEIKKGKLILDIAPENLNLGDPADYDKWQRELDLKRHFGLLKDITRFEDTE